MSDEYQFGDSDLAAERLRLLAAAFEQSSRAFLASLAITPRSIADLGCGPGFTSRMLAHVFPAAQVTGIDSSERFVELARRQPSDRFSFAVADVTRPLPGGPYDLVYCRYLLTHVAQPEAAIDAWGKHLRPGGIVAIEENEWIRTEQGVFTTYLGIANRLLADAGQELYVGAKLDRVARWQNFAKRASSVTSHPVGDRAIARMFLLNLQTWRSRPFVEQHYTADELDRLHAELEALARDGTDSSAITFGLRQLALERR